jgi:cytochrome c-type biogenesis protein CcmH/NrfF
MTERHLAAWAILLLFLLAAGLVWRLRRRRVRRAPERHLRIDLLTDADGEPTAREP